jgi:hypothetical protein
VAVLGHWPVPTQVMQIVGHKNNDDGANYCTLMFFTSTYDRISRTYRRAIGALR